MARTSLEKRRKVRELEARRDALLSSKKKTAVDLSKVRAELKLVRTQ
jgi:hypothetical protein